MNRRLITLANVSTAVPAGPGGARELHLPLGSLYLVSALERAGFEVDFRDYQLFAADREYPLDIEGFCSFLEGAAGIVGVSCMVSMLPFVILGTRLFKQRRPDAVVVLGGPGPSGVAGAIVERMPWIDAVARGEGEETIVEMMQAYAGERPFAGIAGLTCREGGSALAGPSRRRIRDLDGVAAPAYHRAEMASYTNVSVISGRGCPYRCAFCDVGPLWENRTVFRSVSSVVEEIAHLRDRYGVSRVNVADDTFDLRRERAEEFSDAVRPLGVAWSCLTRIDLVDAPLLERMSGAGCDAVFFGIESGSDAVLRRINKRFTIKEATEKVELTSHWMKKIVTSYIWGFPFETLDDLKSTVFSVVSMWYLGAMAGLKLLSPMPLSPLGVEFRERLAFDEELCSVFASLGNVAPGKSAARAGIPDEFITIIRQYPDIFMGFYHVEGEGLREKADYLKRFSQKMRIPF